MTSVFVGQAADGVVVLDKQSGATSHALVARLRRILGIRRIGHAGTLDPMATGVMILGVGRATRLLGHLALHDKRYLATVRLGQRSSTDDAEGELVDVADASQLTLEQLEEACRPLRGAISQVPSTVSAIKVDGKRAYALARAGAEVQLKPRDVVVDRLDILALRRRGRHLDVDIDVECSSGTYIRAIARDLGEALRVGGHLTSLRRTRVGGFTLDDATVLDDQAPPMMTMAEAARRSFPVLEVDEGAARDVAYGRALDLRLDAEVVGLLAPSGRLLALYGPKGSKAAPITVFVGPDDEIGIG